MLQNSLSSGRSTGIRCNSVSAAKCDVYSFGILAWEIVNYSITNRYELPFDEYQHKAVGLFIDGEYDSFQDGTFFNTQDSSHHNGNGTLARHNTFASDYSGDGTSPSCFERTKHSSPSSRSPPLLGEDDIEAELQFRISGLDEGSSGGSGRNMMDFRSGPRKSNVWNPTFETSLYRKIIMGVRPSIPDDCSCCLADLIKECWSGDANRRPDFQDISKRLELQIELE